MLELLILVFSVSICIATGLFVLLQNPGRRLNQIYAVIAFAFIAIVIANSFTLTPSPCALWGMRVVIAATTILSTALYFLVLLMQPYRLKPLLDLKNKIVIAVSVVIACLDLTPLVFSKLNPESSSPSPVPGPGAVFFLLHFVGFVSLSFILLIIGWRRSKATLRTQYLFVLIGMLPILLFAPITSFILPVLLHQVEFVIVTPLYVVFFVLMVAYAIVRHHLFDIKQAAIRSMAYVLTLSVLALIYYFVAYIVSFVFFRDGNTAAASISPINMALALLLAFLFQPLKHFFDRISNKIFYRDAYKAEEFFSDLSELLASTTDLRGLLARASQEIASTLKSEQGFFFLYYSNAISHHLSSGTRGHARLPIYDARTLDMYVREHKDNIFVTELLPGKDESIRRLLMSHNIAILMPLRHRDRTIGYLCLGDRLTGTYTQRDLKVLTTISAELVIAIQNALSVHEVREINASLEQRIRVATAELRESNAQLHRLDTAKNEFVSMASHQLRTPLTSVKGYISMMLDGDVGKISDPQKNALQEAFNSSERMVRLIGDFLSVSRLQTGKFMIEKKPADLIKVVQQEVDGLRIIASTHGQKIAFVHPKRLPEVAIDEAKIRQVIMNFIDNSIYYSRTDSTIHVSLSKLEKEIAFTVEDTGIGVPMEEQHKLFSKFYRATNARQQRPDGTGVGLFLAKKIITAHDGKVIFSSTMGQGSTFGFRLPLKQQTDNTRDNKKDNK